MSGPAAFVASMVGSSVGSSNGGITGAFSQLGNYVAPFGELTFADATNLYVQRLIPTKHYVHLSRMNGYDISNMDPSNINRYQYNKDGILTAEEKRAFTTHQWDNFVEAQTWVPTIDQTNVLYNRGLIDGKAVEYFYHRNGCRDRVLGETIFNSRFEIPGPSDLVRFAVRDAFTPAVVTTFGYAEETPEVIKPWMARQGYGQPVGIAAPPHTDQDGRPVPTHPATWMDLYWWSHWQLPSPTQAFDMYFRLYATSPYGPSPDWKPENDFPLDALKLLLKTSDYPAYWRDRLLAIAYSPLTRVDVRRMYDLNVLKEDGVYHAYRAIGYNDQNAKNLLNFTIELKKQKAVKKLKPIQEAALCKAFTIGAIGVDTYKHHLKALGYTDDQALILIEKCRVEWSFAQLTETLKYVKDAYATGQISDGELYGHLLGVGVAREAAATYERLWKLRKAYRWKHLGADKIFALYDKALLTYDEALSRLRNLGYRESDINALFKEYEVVRSAKLRDAMAKRAEAMAKAAEAAIKKEEKERAKAAADRARSVAKSLAFLTPSRLKQWYEQGLVTAEYIGDVMTDQGIPRSQITLFLRSIGAEPAERIEADEEATRE